MFMKLDATQVEINPWAVTPEKELYCVDAKINLDENALFRQKEIVEMKHQTAASEDVDPNEAKAVAAGLNYIALDGSIGCMVNGAGLAMSTMDIIQLKGGSPANFLDVGGSASKDQVATAFEILSQHPRVDAIWVNIFGGIMRCDVIAQGIIDAAKQVELKVPIVVRLAGSNAEIAQDMMEKFAAENPNVKLIVQPNFDKAADAIVAESKHS